MYCSSSCCTVTSSSEVKALSTQDEVKSLWSGWVCWHQNTNTFLIWVDLLNIHSYSKSNTFWFLPCLFAQLFYLGLGMHWNVILLFQLSPTAQSTQTVGVYSSWIRRCYLNIWSQLNTLYHQWNHKSLQSYLNLFSSWFRWNSVS